MYKALLFYLTLQGKQGIVKLIYRGTVFLYDENETENGGYFCYKSKICEKIKLSTGACNEKVGSLFIPFILSCIHMYISVIIFFHPGWRIKCNGFRRFLIIP